MSGFLDVLLRGAILVLTSLALGGVVWTRLVLRAEPHVKPSSSTRLALRMVAVSALAAAGAQACTLLVALGELAGPAGWPVAELTATTFGRAAVVRIGLAVAVGVLAWRL